MNEEEASRYLTGKYPQYNIGVPNDHFGCVTSRVIDAVIIDVNEEGVAELSLVRCYDHKFDNQHYLEAVYV